MFTLRHYQSDLVANIRAAYTDGHQAVLAVLPTGGGKTICFCWIAESARQRGNRTLILLHRDELIRQTSAALTAQNIPHGVVAAGYAANDGYATNDELIQIASVFTLASDARLSNLDPPAFIVVDECHHLVSKTWLTVLQRFPDACILGVTATPQRLDGRGLGGVFTTLIEGPTVSQLIRAGYLVPPVLYAPPVPLLDLSQIKSRGGDYALDSAALALDKPSITGCVISNYRQYAYPRTAVCFCTTIKHADSVVAEFIAAGIPAATISGKLPHTERRRLLSMFAAGEILVLCSVDLISEGFDLPSIGAAILLRPTQSLSLYLQQVGRALRTCDDKSDAIILDHVENWRRHGIPTEDRTWSLDSPKRTKRQETKIPLRMCPRCYAVAPPSSKPCSQCGHELTADDRRRPELKNGVLIQIDEATAAAARKRDRELKIKSARTLAELIAVGKELNYNAGWAHKRYSLLSKYRPQEIRSNKGDIA